MTNVLRLKRRVSGNAGAPASLLSGELAWNQVDGTIYGGKGDDGSGGATSVVPVAGDGAFITLASAQTVGGAKTFSVVPKSAQDGTASTDLIRKSQLDTALAGKANTSHTHAVADVSGLQAALDLKAPLASPALTGTPTAPTAVSGTSTTQIATTAFVQTAIASFGAGDMTRATYDTDNDGKVDAAEVADAVPWSGVSGKPTSFAPSAHTHALAEVTGLQVALDAKAALASPALTGTPTAPTAVAGTSSTQIATTAFVAGAVAALVDAAPGALDTLNELAAAIGDDASFAATVTNALAGKLTAASNLSDLTNVATARGNLGLGTLALQAANAVAITGGSITGVTLDGGTF